MTSVSRFIFEQSNKIDLIADAHLGSWKDLAAVIMVISTGAILSSSFRKGVGMGLAESGLAISFTTALFFVSRFFRGSPKPPIYVKDSLTHPFQCCILFPLIEEIAFRGILHSSIEALTRSPTASGLISAACFGAVHLANDHPLAKTQAVTMAATGVFYSFLKNRYGILAPIGAHMISNTCLHVLAKI